MHSYVSLSRANNLFSFPLNEHICTLNPEIGTPGYIQSQLNMSFRSLSQVPGQENIHNILQQWPSLPMGKLDKSQWSALREMVTKKLAITQGPPGTGKMFTSVAALKFMLANKRPKDPPIVIAAQTNHALDQLIKQIAEFEPNYIRVGTRSADFDIHKRTIFEMRRDNIVPRVIGGLLESEWKQHNNLTKGMQEVLSPLTPAKSHKPLSAALLVEYGILREDQAESLSKTAKEWEQGGDTTLDPFHAWLGTTVTKFRYRYTCNFGFEDDDYDLEYEQLKEIEMENNRHEEDWAALKDPFVSFVPGLCGDSQDQISLAKIQSYLKETDLYIVPRRYRGIIYDHFRKQLVASVVNKISCFREEYEECTRKFKIGKCERDHPPLRDANIIGLTTTGLSKYRGTIASVNPRVILIEEAAEVLKAPIAVACLPSLQHLILVGDHRQLRGHCAVGDLALEPFNLEVSMFERLVENGIDFTLLQQQRRMITEIRKLVAPLYGSSLLDHPSVNDRPPITGMGRLHFFFFNHDEHESNDSLSSYVNEFEASMVIGLLGYLLRSGVPSTDITILTFYQGQRKLIKRKQNKNIHTAQYHVEIATVDSYQGEENHIILLSLVRSNEHRGIGFLQQINRACVALSRAKSGLFIFGNANCIRKRSEFWDEVVDQMHMSVPRRLGHALPLLCERHNMRTLIKGKSLALSYMNYLRHVNLTNSSIHPVVEDWDKLDVGCNQPCRDNLPCGHPSP
jgi:helicase required for RNAi-mediated heterochromatin assembly 1